MWKPSDLLGKWVTFGESTPKGIITHSGIVVQWDGEAFATPFLAWCYLEDVVSVREPTEIEWEQARKALVEEEDDV